MDDFRLQLESNFKGESRLTLSSQGLYVRANPRAPKMRGGSISKATSY